MSWPAIAICSFSSAVIAGGDAREAVSPIASRRRRGTDRKVTARSLGEELLMATSWHLSRAGVDARPTESLRQVSWARCSTASSARLSIVR